MLQDYVLTALEGELREHLRKEALILKSLENCRLRMKDLDKRLMPEARCLDRRERLHQYSMELSALEKKETALLAQLKVVRGRITDLMQTICARLRAR